MPSELALVRIVKKINSGQAPGQSVYITNADKRAVQVIGPFLGESRIQDEGLAITLGIFGRMFRPASRIDLEGMETIIDF